MSGHSSISLSSLSPRGQQAASAGAAQAESAARLSPTAQLAALDGTPGAAFVAVGSDFWDLVDRAQDLVAQARRAFSDTVWTSRTEERSAFDRLLELAAKQGLETISDPDFWQTLGREAEELLELFEARRPRRLRERAAKLEEAAEEHAERAARAARRGNEARRSNQLSLAAEKRAKAASLRDRAQELETRGNG